MSYHKRYYSLACITSFGDGVLYCWDVASVAYDIYSKVAYLFNLVQSYINILISNVGNKGFTHHQVHMVSLFSRFDYFSASLYEGFLNQINTFIYALHIYTWSMNKGDGFTYLCYNYHMYFSNFSFSLKQKSIHYVLHFCYKLSMVIIKWIVVSVVPSYLLS